MLDAIMLDAQSARAYLAHCAAAVAHQLGDVQRDAAALAAARVGALNAAAATAAATEAAECYECT